MPDAIAPKKDPTNTAPPSGGLSTAFQLLGDFTIAYASGIFIFAALAGIMSVAMLGFNIGAPVFLIVALGALYLSFPALTLSILILLTFHKQILRNLVVWCLAAPLIVTLIHFTIEYTVVFGGRNSIIQYLSTSDVWERAGFSLTVATIAAVTFYWLQSRRRAGP